MTLALAVATPHWVALVADRKVTYIATGKLKNDFSNKLVLFANSLAVAYAGLAEIAPKKTTDLWLAETLLDSPGELLPEVVPHLRDRATEVFRNINHDAARKRHAFLAAGWGRVKPEDAYGPILCRISNFHDDQGNPLPRADDTFKFGCLLLDADEWAIWSIGIMPKNEQRWINRMIRHRLERSYSKPRQIVALLVESVRRVAKIESSVGRDVLAGLLPKETAGAEVFMVTGPDGRGGTIEGVTQEHLQNQRPMPHPIPQMFFEDFPAKRSDGVHYGPTIVSRKKAIVTGITVGPVKQT